MIDVIWQYKSITGMKKITGSIALAALLMGHVGFTIATEESYIFSSSDYQLSEQPQKPAEESAVIPSTAIPVRSKVVGQVGMFSTEDAFFAY